jgi:hypothetical protein
MVNLAPKTLAINIGKGLYPAVAEGYQEILPSFHPVPEASQFPVATQFAG